MKKEQTVSVDWVALSLAIQTDKMQLTFCVAIITMLTSCHQCVKPGCETLF